MVKEFPASGLQSQDNSCFLPREKRDLSLFWNPEVTIDQAPLLEMLGEGESGHTCD